MPRFDAWGLMAALCLQRTPFRLCSYWAMKIGVGFEVRELDAAVVLLSA